jgi:hypothetical protein
MGTEPITIHLDAQAAKLFREATPEQRKKMEMLLGIWLQRAAADQGRTLEQAMDEISRKAQARGLTPEILQSILDE